MKSENFVDVSNYTSPRSPTLSPFASLLAFVLQYSLAFMGRIQVYVNYSLPTPELSRFQPQIIKHLLAAFFHSADFIAFRFCISRALESYHGPIKEKK